MKYLVDSDFLISFSSSSDSNHSKALKIYKNKQNGAELIALNLVFQESTTVVSKKFGMQKAKVFYEMVNKFINTQIKIDDNLETKAWELFLKQTKNGTSFIDCANVAVFKRLNLDRIWSFDEFYKKFQ